MAAEALSPTLIDAGRRILGAADRLGLRPEGAAWVYYHDWERWCFYLVTALHDTIGPFRLHEWLLRAIPAASMPAGIGPLDLYLGSPNATPFYYFPRVEPREGADGVEVRGMNIDGVLHDAVIYRMRPACGGGRAEAAGAARRAEHPGAGTGLTAEPNPSLWRASYRSRWAASTPPP
jgi:hypothetical protein